MSIQGAKRVNVSGRAHEYAEEGLVNDGGQLFCDVCRITVALKKDRIEGHIHSARHADNKIARDRLTMRQQTLQQAFTVRGGNITPPQNAFRLQICRLLLSNGIPLSLLDEYLPPDLSLRRMLERSGMNIGGRRTIADLIPTALADEGDRLKSELLQPTAEPPPITIVFDGSTTVAEVFVIIVRFVTPDCFLQHRVIDVHHLARSLNSNDMGALLIHTLLSKYGLQPKQVKAFSHDRAAVNLSAMRYLSSVFPCALSIGCFSHTLDNAGGQLWDHLPLASAFVSKWIQLISRSNLARALFQEMFNVAPLRANLTRWFSQYHVAEQICRLFPDIQRFLRDCADERIASETSAACNMILNGDNGGDYMVELAVVVDAAGPLVEACAVLEGDGVVSILVSDVCDGLMRHFDQFLSGRTRHAPTVTGVLRLLASNNLNAADYATEDAYRAALRDYVFPRLHAAIAKARPAFEYFHTRLVQDQDLSRPMWRFEACRVFNPAQFIRPDGVPPEDRGSFFGITVGLFGEMTIGEFRPMLQRLDLVSTADETAAVEEFAAYRAEVQASTPDILRQAGLINHANLSGSTTEFLLRWWRDRALRLPALYKIFRLVILYQPSSAAAERLFSMLGSLFNEQQGRAFADYRRAAVMLRYNEMQREALHNLRQL